MPWFTIHPKQKKCFYASVLKKSVPKDHHMASIWDKIVKITVVKYPFYTNAGIWRDKYYGRYGDTHETNMYIYIIISIYIPNWKSQIFSILILNQCENFLSKQTHIRTILMEREFICQAQKAHHNYSYNNKRKKRILNNICASYTVTLYKRKISLN